MQDVKTRHHLPSDYALAGKLDLTRASISRFVNGKDFLGDQTAMKVADLLELDAAYVVACIHAERAKHEGEKKLWERIATMAIGVSAFLAVVLISPHLFADPSGYGVYAVGFIGKMPSLYIMSNSIAEYWYVFTPLIILLILAAPRHTPPKKPAK